MSPDDSLAPIRAAIVDDEPLARSNLKILLRRYPQVEIVAEPASGRKALEEIRRTGPDLVFLDIQMPDCDGFEVLEGLGCEAPPGVIFVTAYDRHAIRAFDAGVLDYLLKPFDHARFERALNRALEKIRRYRTSAGQGSLVVKSGGRILFLQTAEIDWIEAADYYASVHVGEKTHLSRRSLSTLEDELDPAIFCRIHRSAIVNLRRVQALQFNLNGEFEVLLHDGRTLPVSRRYRKQLQTVLAESHGLSAEFSKDPKQRVGALS